MTPQEELAKYFEVCGYAPDDVISIVTRAAADGPLHWSFVPVSDAPRQIAARSRINCWFSANPMSQPEPKYDEDGKLIPSRGSTADVTAVRALWADLDIKTGGMPSAGAAKSVMKELATMLGARPVAIVRSGHGFQPRWRLTQDSYVHMHEFAGLIERFGRLVQVVAERFGGKADAVYDMARIIRAPYTTNIKPELAPVETDAWLYEHGESIDVQRLQEVLDAYVPAVAEPKRDSAPGEIRHVGNERGNAYVRGALESIRSELLDLATWPVGKTDAKGRGWEKVQADAALRLASLAKAGWNSLEIDDAQRIFTDAAPTDDKWTVRDVIKKWQSQVRRAEPAEAPADTDDPLAGGGAPHLPAARAAAVSIWADEGDDGEADSAGGPAVASDDTRGGVASPSSSATLTAPWQKHAWDDFGNADRVVALYGDVLRWCPPLRSWLKYHDGAWKLAEEGGEKAVQDMLRQLPELEGEQYSDVEYRKGKSVTSDRIEFLDWVRQNRATSRVTAAARVIRRDELLNVMPIDFDAWPMLLNVPNGVVDLQTSELIEHHPALLLRQQLDVVFDPDAKAPLWESFLAQAMPSADMRDYLQRIVGYTLTGDTREQVLFFHVGLSGAGKSVFLEILAALLGEMANSLPQDTLLNKKQAQHPTDISDLEGKRFIYLDETPEGARLDETLLKRLTGQATISARGMGENFRRFQMVGKIHLATNHDPHISDDPAVHRRIHYIPWRHVLPVEQRDPLLRARIISEELPGVLAWAVEGVRRWQSDRLAMPAEALVARAAYIASEDEFQMFIDEELIVGAESFTPFRELYRRYTQWCDGLRMKPMGSKAFTQKLVARKIEPKRTTAARGFKVALQHGRWVGQDPLS